MGGGVNGHSLVMPGHPRLWCPRHSRPKDGVASARLCPLLGWNLQSVGVDRAFPPCIREHRLEMSSAFVPLALCGIIIAARIIMHGAVVVATGGVIGAGKILDAVDEIGLGIAQAFST